MKSLFFILLLTLTSCDTKDDLPKLPPITTTGENTFGCYVDGILLTPRDPEPRLNIVPLKTAIRTHVFRDKENGNLIYREIRIGDYKSNLNLSITFHFEGMEGLNDNRGGTYSMGYSNCLTGLNSPKTPNIFCGRYNTELEKFEWYCSIKNKGQLTILRNDNNIFSGTFSFEAANEDNSMETIKVTQGRFDFNFNTLRDKKYP